MLWLDCCMVQMSIAAGSVSLRQCPTDGSPRPLMQGFATMSGLKAQEFPIAEDGNRVHGVFTWTLLQGLRKFGAVDAETLKGYILNSMKELIPAELRNAPEYKAEPRIDVLPQSLPRNAFVFGRGAPRSSTSKVTFNIGIGAPGQELRVWSGSPPSVAASGRLTAGGLTLDLPRGLYVAEVAEAQVRQGIEADGIRDLALDLTERGRPVKVPPDPQPKLVIEAVTTSAPRSLWSALASTK